MDKKYQVTTMRTEDVANLPSGNKPTDNKLLKLLTRAYKGKFPCHTAVILIEGIKPFSNYRPEISKEFRDYFHYRLAKGFPSTLYVYQEGENFIMSDDYMAYYQYLDDGLKEVPCTVLGDPIGKYVSKKGKPFILDPAADPIYIEL